MASRNLVLDYDGCTVHYPEERWKHLWHVMAETGSDLLGKSYEEVYSVVMDLFLNPRPDRYYYMPYFMDQYEDLMHMEYYLEFHRRLDVAWKADKSCEETSKLMADFLARGGQIYYFSNGSSEHVIRGLTELGYMEHIPKDHVLGLDIHGLENCKKRDGSFDKAAAYFGINPTQSVFLEDSAQNLVEAKVSGFETALVDWTGKHPVTPYCGIIQGRHNSLKDFLISEIEKL